jgi:hypothetical protein
MYDDDIDTKIRANSVHASSELKALALANKYNKRDLFDKHYTDLLDTSLKSRLLKLAI